MKSGAIGVSELRYVAVAAVAALGLAAHTWAGSPVVLTAENAEVVVAPKAAKLTRFAASEMTNFHYHPIAQI